MLLADPALPASLQKEEDTTTGTGDPPRKKPTRLAIGEHHCSPILLPGRGFPALRGTRRAPTHGPAQWPSSCRSNEVKCCTVVVVLFSFFPVSPGVEGGFDLSDEKFEYDEDVKIVILPDYLEIARDGLGGLPDFVRDRV